MLLAFSFTPFLLAFYILITWGICAAILIGLGSLLLRPLIGNHRPFEAFWCGLFLAVLLLQCLHFVVAINWQVEAFLGVLGLLGVISNVRSYLSHLGSSWPRSNVFPSLVWSLLIVYAIALRCVGPCDHYDTGFYGAMAVRWFNTYPLVPGLANLMAQLGYNPSVFLCVAALNHGTWSGLAFHLFPGFLLSALTCAVAPAFCRVWRGESVSPADIFLSILSVPGIFWATNAGIVGTNTDLPTTVVALISFYCLVAIYSREKSGESSWSSGENNAALLLLALLLFPLALAFKISGVLFAFLGWLLAFAALWRSAIPPQLRKRLLLVGLLLPAVLLATWSLRGIFISGYPFFPSSFLGVPVDWRVPVAWTDFHARNVRSWARIAWAPMSQTEGWHWVSAWFSVVVRNRVDFIFPALFSALGTFALLQRAESWKARWLWALLPGVAGLLFWFWRAPAIRFGEPVIWGTAATLGAAALVGALRAHSKGARRVILAGLLIAGVWCSYPRTIWRAFFRPSFEQNELPKLPEAPVAPYKVDTNLSILVPYKKNQCWDTPLPCSPYFFDSLRLRHDSDLRSGFSDAQVSGEVDKSSAFHKLYWKGPEPEPDQ